MDNMERFADCLASLLDMKSEFSEREFENLKKASFDRFMNPKCRVDNLTFKTFLNKTKRAFEKETFFGWSDEWNEVVRDIWWIGGDDPEGAASIIAESHDLGSL